MWLWYIVYAAIVALLGLGTYYCDAWNYTNIFFLVIMSTIILVFLIIFISKLHKGVEYLKGEKVTNYANSIDVKIRIENVNKSKSLCETVPAMMTGLGLLGTFLGLIIGLKNFNTDYDLIQSSISSLLGAIKTAFITSIYGVAFSMFFNAMFKIEYSKFKYHIDSFYEKESDTGYDKLDKISAVPDKVSKTNEKLESIANALYCREREEEAKAMPVIDKLNRANSVLWLIGNKIDDIYTVEGCIKEIDNSLKETISTVPEKVDQSNENLTLITKVLNDIYSSEADLNATLNDIKKNISEDITEQFTNSLNKISETVVDFMNSFGDKQRELLNTLIDQYFTRMNEEIFGGQLNELRTVLESINDESRKIAENMNLLSNNLLEASNTVKLTNDNYSKLNEQFVTYLGQVNAYQVIITESNESLNENLKELTDKYNEHAVNTHELAGINNQLTEDVKQLANSCDLLRSESETSRDNREDLIKFVKNLADTSNENRSKMTEKVNNFVSDIESKTTEFINKSSELINTTSEKSNEISAKLYQTLNESYENYSKINNTFSGYIDNVNKYQENITVSNNSLNEKLTVLTEKYEEQNNNAHDIITVNKILTDNIHKLSDTCQILRDESEASRSNRENLRETIADMVRTSNDNNHKMYAEISELVNTINDQTADLITKSRELVEVTTRSTHDISKDLYDTVHGSIEDKTASLREAAAELKRSVDTLSTNYADVTSKLNSGLGETFEQFDTNIAFFANRFYALINEMLSVANNIPDQLRDNTSKIFEEMARSNSEKALEELKTSDNKK